MGDMSCPMQFSVRRVVHRLENLLVTITGTLLCLEQNGTRALSYNAVSAIQSEPLLAARHSNQRCPCGHDIRDPVE
ncbi:hypothetical protein Mapa_005323 [Marchantia paleacea]|nr:hypothetical protein Mapa_005323 [Marchantia paleacea]